MSMTDWCELRLLQLLVADVPSMYLALFTAAPAEDGTGGTEVSGAGYARQLIPFGTPATDESGNTGMASTETFAFEIATESWGTVSAWGVYDASEGGHLLWVQSFDAPQNVPAGSVVAVSAGSLTVSVE